jgi:ribosomal protein L37E
MEESLKQQLVDRAMEQLAKKSVKAECPRCGANDWNASATSYLIADIDRPVLAMPPPRVPVLSLMCKNCGHIEFHNLKLLGVIPLEPAK